MALIYYFILHILVWLVRYTVIREIFMSKYSCAKISLLKIYVLYKNFPCVQSLTMWCQEYFVNLIFILFGESGNFSTAELTHVLLTTSNETISGQQDLVEQLIASFP